MSFCLILSILDFLFFLWVCFMFPFVALIHFFGVVSLLLVFERWIRPLDDIVSHFFRVLASLNLPAAIEDISGDTVPQSILTKSTSVIEQGGIQTVDQLIKELPELLQRNREILDEVRFKRFAFQVNKILFGPLASSRDWDRRFLPVVSQGIAHHSGEFIVAHSLPFSVKRNSEWKWVHMS